jgi:hypothetical protein
MRNLPASVLSARETANICSDELHDAWDRLNSNHNPTMDDLERWLEVKKRFEVAQDHFQTKLSQFLAAGFSA